MLRRSLFISSLIVLCASCGKSDSRKASESQPATTTGPTTTATTEPTPPAAPDPVEAPWYRGQLESPSDKTIGPLPFFFQLPPAGAKGQALLRSADLDLRLQHDWQGQRVTIRFPLYRAVITGTVGADGALTGAWESQSQTWGAGTMPFSATPITGPESDELFANQPRATTNGTRPAELPLPIIARIQGEKSGAIKLAVTKNQRGTGHVAMYEGAGGNTSRMGGSVSGNRLRFVAFEGNGTYLLDAEIAEDGSLSGTWKALHGPIVWSEPLTGESLGDDFELERTVTIADRQDGLRIGDADLSSYRGKPTIVELAGSWCTNCAYAAPFLVEMYEKYHGQGLAMVSLVYEMTEDQAYNQKQAEVFRAEHGIPWQVIAMSGDFTSVGENLPQSLENIDLSGLPIALFVSKSGQLLHVHSGFPARGSEQHKRVRAMYEGWIKELLATE